MLKGKTILLGVSGSIAAYKMADLASQLVKAHAEVHVLMTRNACQFITPVTFETLTGHKCIVDTFDRQFEFQVEHVSLAQQADLFLVAPATANIIGQIAAGICDDMLTTTLMACHAPKVIAPAMNVNMWDNPILQGNIRKLKAYGYDFVMPVSGRLACGDTGRGKLAPVNTLFERILSWVALPHDMEGTQVLISAGPTCEAIDPVRFITNHSSGKMGYALAKIAKLRGAEVLLVSGPVHLEPFEGVTVVPVRQAAEMHEEVMRNAVEADYVVMCAAVADYTPLAYTDHKIKKGEGDLSLPLKRTTDILAELGANKRPGQRIIGFSMETHDLIAHSRQKLERKHVDLICANSLTSEGTGFGVDTNRITLVSPNGVETLPLCSKEETANLIWDRVLHLEK